MNESMGGYQRFIYDNRDEDTKYIDFMRVHNPNYLIRIYLIEAFEKSMKLITEIFDKSK